MREKLKNEPSFKFYDDDSLVLCNKAKNKINVWEEDSEISDDEIKLKTIKNFSCFQNQ